MNVVHVGEETTLTALVRHLLPGRPGARAIDSAAAAIRAANPGVNLDSLTPGTLVFVPELQRGISPTATVASGPSATLRALLQDATAELVSLGEQQQAATVAQAKSLAAALRDPGVREAADGLASLADALQMLERDLRSQTSQAKATMSLLAQATKGWNAQFDRLTGA